MSGDELSELRRVAAVIAQEYGRNPLGSNGPFLGLRGAGTVSGISRWEVVFDGVRGGVVI